SILLASFAAGLCVGQTLNNQTLNGKYFFRHVSLGMNGNAAGAISDPRSLLGTITFDGAGKYTYTGQQITGTGSASAATGSGVYSVDAGGFVSLDSPLRNGAKVNARYGAEAVLGSSTEPTDNTYDLFVAIPAPTGGATLAGSFNAVSLEF